MFDFCNSATTIQAYIGAVISLSMGFSVVLLLITKSFRVIKSSTESICKRYSELHSLFVDVYGMDYSLPFLKKDFDYYRDSLIRKVEGKLYKLTKGIAKCVMYLSILISVSITLLLYFNCIPEDHLSLLFVVPIIISLLTFIAYIGRVYLCILYMSVLPFFYKKTIKKAQLDQVPALDL